MTKDYKIVSALQCAVSSFFSFSMSSGSIPVAVSPCFGGYPLGFYKYLGIGTVHQFALSVALLGYYAGFSLILFYQRFLALQIDSIIFKSRILNYSIYSCWIFLTFIVNTLMNAVLHVENIEQMKQTCLKQFYNGDPQDITREDTVIASFSQSGSYFTIYFCLLLIFVVVYTLLLCLMGYFTYCALLNLRTKMSEKTLRRHSHHIKVLYIQTLVHTIGFSIPAGLFVLTPMLDIGVPEIVDVAMIVLSFACILSPAYVFFNISTYKRAIMELFKLKNQTERSTIFTM